MRLYLAAFGVLAISSQALVAESIDLFNLDQGTTVIYPTPADETTSPVYPGSDIRNIMGGNFGTVEPGNTIFQDGYPAGTPFQIKFETATPVAPYTIALYAAGDTPVPSTDNGSRRTFDQFNLYSASTDSTNDSTYQLIFSENIPVDPVTGYTSYVDPATSLLVLANLPVISAQFFIAQFVQFSSDPSCCTGPRIIELEAFATPEPAPLFMIAGGLCAFSMLLRRRLTGKSIRSVIPRREF